MEKYIVRKKEKKFTASKIRTRDHVRSASIAAFRIVRSKKINNYRNAIIFQCLSLYRLKLQKNLSEVGFEPTPSERTRTLRTQFSN